MLATASSDQTVRIFELQDQANNPNPNEDPMIANNDPTAPSNNHGGVGSEWKQTAAFKSHSGAIWKVTWAHPEFGRVLATSSFDRTIAIWEECPTDMQPGGVSSSRPASKLNSAGEF